MTTWHHKIARPALRLAGATSLVFGLAGAATAQGVVKIGGLEAQTGPASIFGLMPSQGVRMAVEEINKGGGFDVAGKRYTLQLISPDTQGNPQQALVQAKKLLEEEKVQYIFGPYLTNVFNAVSPYVQQYNGKVLLMGGATGMHGALGKPNMDFVIKTMPWDTGSAGYGSMMVDLLVKRGVKKVAILMQNDAGGKAVVDIYTPLFKDRNIELITEFFEANTKDFTSTLAKLAAAKPDYLFPGYTDTSLYDIVRQASEVGMTHFFITRGSIGPGMKNAAMIDSYIAWVPKYFEQAEKTQPKVAKFVADYKAFYKTPFPYDQAPQCATSCYDHVFMLVEAMKKAGTVTEVPKVKAALLAMQYQGLWNIRYDATGESILNFDVVEVKRGGKIDVTHIEPK
ncbi:MAG: ABC transporter substrate-binding protein [Betaproteobacteria bacterium]|nr:ABC transporter substrate-binding protein [Betaproteobacteria bacterium]